jgi:hypothetical protein
MVTSEDALKAIEALTETVRGIVSQPDLRVRWIEELNALRMGCEALRFGDRGSGWAQNIIQRPFPQRPPEVVAPPGLVP